MTSTGTTVLTYNAKRKMRLGAHYDKQIGLGAVTLDGDIRSTTYLNVEELARLHSRLGYVLDQMIETQAIGFDGYSKSLDRAINQLEQEAQPKPVEKPTRRRQILPPCDLTPEQMRAASIAEIEKIKEAKRRGEYK